VFPWHSINHRRLKEKSTYLLNAEIQMIPVFDEFNQTIP